MTISSKMLKNKPFSTFLLFKAAPAQRKGLFIDKAHKVSMWLCVISVKCVVNLEGWTERTAVL